MKPNIIVTVITTVTIRSVRSPTSSAGDFSVFELLVGFMVKLFAEKIDLCINDKISQRLDKALTQIMPVELGLSRSRVQELIISGAVSALDGKLLTDPAVKAYYGLKVTILLPRLNEPQLLPENIKLDIVYEDTDLLVVNKPAGMVVHPAPGAMSGTLVHALLFHCGSTLSGIGGVKRPGIVHRIDKNTSGLLAVAKTDLAHSGLAKQFLRHSVDRKYIALVHGAFFKHDQKLKKISGLTFEPDGRIKISGRIGRHKFDRKKMAVHESLGRHAVTRIRVTKHFGLKESPIASMVECQLETGRTHQIRVHLNYLGHGIIGDQTYRSATQGNFNRFKHVRPIIENFERQALHAASLGFFHPITNEWLSFSSKIPKDMVMMYHSLDELNTNF